ncbi:hypothetical protein F4703DRAFT_1912720 [Phycomyces blakesleeanus]
MLFFCTCHAIHGFFSSRQKCVPICHNCIDDLSRTMRLRETIQANNASTFISEEHEIIPGHYNVFDLGRKFLLYCTDKDSTVTRPRRYLYTISPLKDFSFHFLIRSESEFILSFFYADITSQTGYNHLFCKLYTYSNIKQFQTNKSLTENLHLNLVSDFVLVMRNWSVFHNRYHEFNQECRNRTFTLQTQISCHLDRQILYVKNTCLYVSSYLLESLDRAPG